MSAACVALAVLLAGTPEGAAMLDVVVEASEFERRQRRLVGAFAVTTGAGQVATGAILLDSAQTLGDPLSRSGRLNVIAGSAAIVQGVITLAQPGPLRRLRKTPAYARLVAHPESPWASRAFDREWAVAARRTRGWRLWVGGV
ncbi:MAG: hypothetical protein KUG77_18905, partial [Nannocystaceae bacterium]|nr:hypothetical protein [Nannocystaceae bacterium]